VQVTHPEEQQCWQTEVTAEIRANQQGLKGYKMVIGRSSAAWVSDLGSTKDFGPEVNSHRWARTSLRDAMASPVMFSTWCAVTSFSIGEWSASFAGARWKNYLLRASSRNA
jgi:hypothetical protein